MLVWRFLLCQNLSYRHSYDSPQRRKNLIPRFWSLPAYNCALNDSLKFLHRQLIYLSNVHSGLWLSLCKKVDLKPQRYFCVLYFIFSMTSSGKWTGLHHVIFYNSCWTAVNLQSLFSSLQFNSYSLLMVMSLHTVNSCSQMNSWPSRFIPTTCWNKTPTHKGKQKLCQSTVWQ